MGWTLDETGGAVSTTRGPARVEVQITPERGLYRWTMTAGRRSVRGCCATFQGALRKGLDYAAAESLRDFLSAVAK